MRSLAIVFSTEMFKIRKSTMIKIVALLFTIAPITAAFFTFILQDPDMAQNAGFISDKAHIVGEANAQSYIEIHAQMIAVGGIIVYGFITSWVFGREYIDRTIVDLLDLPYPRSIIVIGKFIAIFLTNLLITLFILIIGTILGLLIKVDGFSVSFMISQLPFLSTVAILTILLSAPVAFFASAGKGYLLPLGFVIIILIFSQIITAIGFGHYFPWSIPALYSGMTGDEFAFSSSSLLILVSTILAGIIGTLVWYSYADQQ